LQKKTKLRFANQIKLYRKLRFRKGFGVHSPFVFNLITKVIEEKAPYYAFDEIEKFRANLRTGKSLAETQHRNYGALLFRLIRWFNCRSALQIRGLNGIMSLYIASASSACTCTVLEEDPGMTAAARRFAELKALNNLRFMTGDYATNIASLISNCRPFDLIFINMQGNAGQTAEILRQIQGLVCENTVLVVDGIAANKEMKSLWKRLKNYPATRVTVDLMAAGMVFFDSKLNRQHYKSYFDYPTFFRKFAQ
jgi:predicted O-methyltransferase YrrM